MEVGEWRVAGASTLGTSHQKTGAPCQDAFKYESYDSAHEGEVILLMVSDGAGSARFSDIGAELACREFASNLQLYLADQKLIASLDSAEIRRWLDNVVEVLSTRAAQNEAPLRDYACTLLAAVLSIAHTAFIQIGDGAIVVREGPEDWCYIFWPQHGEYINTTRFITDPSSLDQLEFSLTTNAIHELALFTDGIESLVLQYATNTVHSPFFNSMLPPVRALPQAGLDANLSEKLATYLASPVICSRTDDDKTLLLASRLKTL
jgi:hypothetical protein